MSLTIAICGLGSAGRSRLKAIESSSHCQLSGIISRRSDVATKTFEQVLADTTVDAIAISTENTDHPSRVRACLGADKHVLCDYPLAFDRRTAESLYDLAAKKNLILHVEHIGLLTKSHQEARQKMKTLGNFKNGSYLFEGGWNEKIANPKISGPLSFLCISRLMQVFDLLGPLRCTDFHSVHDANSLNIDLTLTHPNGRSFSFTEKRQVGLKRQRQFSASFELGDVNWKSEPVQENLFHKDLEIFLGRIDKKMSCYYDEKVLLDVIGLLEQKGGVT